MEQLLVTRDPWTQVEERHGSLSRQCGEFVPLLHTKVNDPCPNVVLEALASGLPVVHPASGGT
ncbi:MAG TPA: hypothetical protein VNT23_10265, partial [Gaiellaceae bacterium]|nr:hypothetical protein [Gaiellaceae bacterium]